MKKISIPKVALVTGAARRIGKAVSKALHQAGFNIVIHYHTSETFALNLFQELNQIRQDSAIIVQADLKNANDRKKLITQAVDKWQTLDVLINNASRFYATLINTTTELDWDDLIDANLKAPFFLSQLAAPFLTEKKGTIINITDTHANKPLKNYGVYCISKGGLETLTKVLARELGPSIRVNAIAPGAIAWPEGVNTLTEDLKQKIINSNALKRTGEPDDIAKAVLYLVQDADYMTGNVLTIDGGRALYG